MFSGTIFLWFLKKGGRIRLLNLSNYFEAPINSVKINFARHLLLIKRMGYKKKDPDY